MDADQLARLKLAVVLVRQVHRSLEGDWPSEWSTLLNDAEELLIALIEHPENAYV